MMDPVVPTEDVPVESEEQRKAKMHMHTELQAQAERAKAVQKSECKDKAAPTTRIISRPSGTNIVQDDIPLIES